MERSERNKGDRQEGGEGERKKRMRKRVRDQGREDEERRNKGKGIKERSEEREKRKDGQLLTPLTLTVLSSSLTTGMAPFVLCAHSM